LDQHESRITGLSNVQESHAASLLEHQRKHSKHEIALKDINGRFQQNSAEVQVLLKGDEKINSAIMEAENVLATKVLEGQEEVKVASEHAFEVKMPAFKNIGHELGIEKFKNYRQQLTPFPIAVYARCHQSDGGENGHHRRGTKSPNGIDQNAHHQRGQHQQ
jgi:hypothetical protein